MLYHDHMEIGDNAVVHVEREGLMLLHAEKEGLTSRERRVNTYQGQLHLHFQ